MTVSGDREGQSYLLTTLNTAIILGGTLIMLPEDMIEENIQNGKLDGELQDAFGEVANIIAGVFTQAFVDKYAKTIRFIKKSVEELVPTKIDPTSDEPFPPGNYYVAGASLAIGEQDLGRLEFVVPAALFDLETKVAEEPEPQEAPQKQPKPLHRNRRPRNKHLRNRPLTSRPRRNPQRKQQSPNRPNRNPPLPMPKN